MPWCGTTRAGTPSVPPQPAPRRWLAPETTPLTCNPFACSRQLLSPDNGGTNADGTRAEWDLVEAREQLAFVIPEFEAMGMVPALARARTLRERLGGGSGTPLA